MVPVRVVGLYVLPGPLDYAARRAKMRRGGKNRAAPLGMTEKRQGALEDLLEADVDNVAELGRAWWQLGEIQEVGIESVVAGWRRIDSAAAFENAGGILRIKEADH